MMPIATLLAAAAVAHAPPSLTGLWRNPSGSVTISIDRCGQSLCGTVRAASAKAKRDALKGTPRLIGTRLLTDLAPDGPNRWTGQIFIPDINMHGSAKLELVGSRQLKVAGCKLALCRSQLWSRVGKK